MSAAGGFNGAVARALATPGQARVVGFAHNGRRFWLKRAMDRGRVLRWQKGDPRHLLDRERRAIAAMGEAGQPVPRLIASGDGYVVITDTGPSLDRLWQADPVVRGGLARAGAAALARLHAAGMAHGSPHLRNLTRARGRRIGFIDLEQATLSGASPRQRQHDLAVYLYGLFGLGATGSQARAALDAYAEVAGQADIAALARRMARWRWLVPLTAPLRWHERRFRPDRSPLIYVALARTLRFLSRQG